MFICVYRLLLSWYVMDVMVSFHQAPYTPTEIVSSAASSHGGSRISRKLAWRELDDEIPMLEVLKAAPTPASPSSPDEQEVPVLQKPTEVAPTPASADEQEVVPVLQPWMPKDRMDHVMSCDSM